MPEKFPALKQAGFSFADFAAYRAKPRSQGLRHTIPSAVEALESRTMLSGINNLGNFDGTNGSFLESGVILSGTTLYGTTIFGGANGNGVVYSLPTSGGTPKVLASFINAPNGEGSWANLILSGSTLYGTIGLGSPNALGEVFSLPVAGGTPKILASFNGLLNLILSGNTFYGTISGGGANGLGAVFSLPETGGTPTILGSFNGTDGETPAGGLILSGSTLYGTTSAGGANGDGAVFSIPIAITGNAPKLLGSFDKTDGQNPNTGVILSGSTLYGATYLGGGNGEGAIFLLPVAGGTPKLLASLSSTSGANPSGLVLSGNTLYGTTYDAGSFFDGSVFSVPVNGGTPTVLGGFNFTNGLGPRSALLLSGNTLYGTTEQGGSVGGGTVFDILVTAATGASKVAFTTEPGNATAGATMGAVKVAIEDFTGVVQTGNTSSVTLSIVSGPAGATLGGTLTVAAVNGVATFSNLSLTKAGTYTLKAVDGSLTSATSTSLTISPAAASQLMFASTPVGTAAGTNLAAFKVDVEDKFGNIVTTNTSKVTLATKTGPGAITGTAAVNAIAGVATFSAVNFHLAGTYTIGASDTGLTTATSGSFKIAAGAVAHLAFVQNPTNVVAGVNIAPGITVKATDAFGNVIAGASVKLAIGSGPVGGALFGTVTATTAATGIATFSAISAHVAGGYTLTASVGAIISPKSTAFTVSHAALAHLAFVQNPTNVVAGVNDAPAITVKATDAFGNVVSGASVTLKIGSGPVGGAIVGTATATTNASGIATFSGISFHVAGSYTLTASDGAIVSPKSTAFTVSAAKAAKLVFTTMPVGAKHGVVFAVKVSVEDAFGNVLIADNTGMITLALAAHPAGSTLAGTLTANVVKGVATFSNLSVTLAGSYSFKASDSFAVAAVTSSSIVVS